MEEGNKLIATEGSTGTDPRSALQLMINKVFDFPPNPSEICAACESVAEMCSGFGRSGEELQVWQRLFKKVGLVSGMGKTQGLLFFF